MENYEYDKVYVNGVAFPYTPEHDAGQNDVDLDSYTNTKGYTVRHRVRHDAKTLDFNIPTMTGQELKDLLELRNPVWFNATFFDEAEWAMVTKKMYCSSPTYHKYYIDIENPLKNIYTDIQWKGV